MLLEAEVKEDGTLVADVPKHLRGKKFQIIIRSKQGSSSQWSAIAAVLKAADRLNIPRRNLNEILEGIHSFRESS